MPCRPSDDGLQLLTSQLVFVSSPRTPSPREKLCLEVEAARRVVERHARGQGTVNERGRVRHGPRRAAAGHALQPAAGVRAETRSRWQRGRRGMRNVCVCAPRRDAVRAERCCPALTRVGVRASDWRGRASTPRAAGDRRKVPAGRGRHPHAAIPG